MRRLVPTVLFLACAGGMTYGLTSFRPPEPPAKVVKAPPPPARQLVVVRGRVTPDKAAILADPVIMELFAKAGLRLSVDLVPSRELAISPNPVDQHAFSWAGDDESAALAVEAMPTNAWLRSTSTPFYTTPVILTWGPAADALKRAGMVSGSGRWRTVDMKALMASSYDAKRWSDLPSGSGWTSDRPLQIRMPDLDSSGTATMLLAIAAQLANEGREVVSSEKAVEIAKRLAPVFRQSGQTKTTKDAISEFVSFGISRTPLLLATEADAIQMLSAPNAPKDIVVLYPDETVVSQQSFLPYTLMGRKIGQVLERRDVQQVGLRHGFRVAGVNQVPGTWKDPQDAPPSTFSTILEMPEADIMETMIDTIVRGETKTARRPDTARQPPAEPEKQQPVPQRPVNPSAMVAGEMYPPERPTIDPNADADSQRIIAEEYVRKLEAYRARQRALKAAAGDPQ